MSYRVLIADDNFYVRRGLRDLFNHQSEFMICGESENGKEAIQEAQELHPDLIVLDLSMPVMNGLAAARILKQLMPKVPVLMFSAFSDSGTEAEALSVGISK